MYSRNTFPNDALMVKPSTSKNIEALFIQMLQFAWGDWHKVNKTSSYCDPIHVFF